MSLTTHIDGPPPVQPPLGIGPSGHDSPRSGAATRRARLALAALAAVLAVIALVAVAAGPGSAGASAQESVETDAPASLETTEASVATLRICVRAKVHGVGWETRWSCDTSEPAGAYYEQRGIDALQIIGWDFGKMCVTPYVHSVGATTRTCVPQNGQILTVGDPSRSLLLDGLKLEVDPTYGLGRVCALSMVLNSPQRTQCAQTVLLGTSTTGQGQRLDGVMLWSPKEYLVK